MQKILMQNKKMIALIGAFILLVIGVIWWINHYPYVDTNKRYAERLQMANQSNEILISINDLANADGDVEAQIGSDEYDTLLGIDNGKNSQEINDEYKEAQEALKEITKMVADHEAEVKSVGGITSVEDLHALDTLPITDKDRRQTILKNLGSDDKSFNEKRSNEKEIVVKEPIEHHHHDHDHDEHDHDHDGHHHH